MFLNIFLFCSLAFLTSHTISEDMANHLKNQTGRRSEKYYYKSFQIWHATGLLFAAVGLVALILGLVERFWI